MGEANGAKARALYAAIRCVSFYRNHVARDARSWMKRDFYTGKIELDPIPAQAAQAGLHNLKGHRVLGALRRVSQCNCRSEGVRKALVGFMRESSATRVDHEGAIEWRFKAKFLQRARATRFVGTTPAGAAGISAAFARASTPSTNKSTR